MDIVSDRIHATCVALGDHCVLIRGPSGSGKSDLALRFLASRAIGGEDDRQRRLVADDQVELRRQGSRVMALAPSSFNGKLEVRGVGIVDVASIATSTVVLVVDLVMRDAVERMPDWRSRATLLGVTVPHLQLHAFDVSAPLKLALAIELAREIYSKS